MVMKGHRSQAFQVFTGRDRDAERYGRSHLLDDGITVRESGDHFPVAHCQPGYVEEISGPEEQKGDDPNCHQSQPIPALGIERDPIVLKDQNPGRCHNEHRRRVELRKQQNAHDDAKQDCLWVRRIPSPAKKLDRRGEDGKNTDAVRRSQGEMRNQRRREHE